MPRQSVHYLKQLNEVYSTISHKKAEQTSTEDQYNNLQVHSLCQKYEERAGSVPHGYLLWQK